MDRKQGIFKILLSKGFKISIRTIFYMYYEDDMIELIKETLDYALSLSSPKDLDKKGAIRYPISNLDIPMTERLLDLGVDINYDFQNYLNDPPLNVLLNNRIHRKFDKKTKKWKKIM